MTVSFLCSWITASAFADPLLEKLDEQLATPFRHSTITLRVDSPRRSRQYLLEQWSDEQRSAVLISAPARHKGTKLLRQGEELWTRLPQLSGVERVAGHLLRRPVLGSDLSYFDLLSSPRLNTEYTVLETKEVPCPAEHKSTCIELILRSLDPNNSYPKRTITVLTEPMAMLTDLRFAQSGEAIKRFTYSNHRTIDGHNLPFLIEVTQPSRNSTTTLQVNSIDLTKTEPLTPQLQHRWLEL